MRGIQFVTDEKGRKVAVQIDLRIHGSLSAKIWDEIVSESRLKEKGIPYVQYRAKRLKRVLFAQQAQNSQARQVTHIDSPTVLERRRAALGRPSPVIRAAM